jgi:hypothetical protein
LIDQYRFGAGTAREARPVPFQPDERTPMSQNNDRRGARRTAWILAAIAALIYVGFLMRGVFGVAE